MLTMRLVYIALLLVGCGSGAQPTADLALPSSPEDLSVVDLALPSVPPDMVVLPCSSPKAGIYNESISFTYAPAGGGMAIAAGNTQPAIVRNDGTLTRPMATFPAPNLFHCNFTAVDPKTCLATCCPDQASSPLVYVDGGGWILWLGGACAYQTTTGAQYVANVTMLDGYFVR